MPKNENEWFSFVLGFAAAILVIVILTIDYLAKSPLDRISAEYCPAGFDKSHLVLYQDRTWDCTDGIHEQQVK